MADDLGGDALAHLALGLGIDRQGEVGMGLDVDEAGSDRESLRIDHLARGRIAEVCCDSGDAILTDADIGAPARLAAAVEHEPAADQEVVTHELIDRKFACVSRVLMCGNFSLRGRA